MRKQHMRSRGSKTSLKNGRKPGVGRNIGFVSRNPSKTPWATQDETHVVYSDTVNLNLTANTTQQYIYRANSVYDPDQTGTGGSPIGHTLLSQQYNRYLVMGVSYSIDYSVLKDPGNCRVSAAFINGNNIPVNPDIFAVANGKNGFVSAYTSKSFKGRFDLTKLNADPEKYRTDDRYAALVTSNPLEVMSLVLSTFSSVDTAITFGVKLTYHVYYFDIDVPVSGSLLNPSGRTLSEAITSGKRALLERKRSLTNV